MDSPTHDSVFEDWAAAGAARSAASSSEQSRDVPKAAAGWREIFSIIALVVVGDLFIYRAHGFAAAAALCLAAPALLALGSPFSGRRGWQACLGVLLALLAAKLLFCGHPEVVAVGFLLTIGFAMATAGRIPYAESLIPFMLQAAVAPFAVAPQYARAAATQRTSISTSALLKVLIPLGALIVFSTIFVLANPDLAESSRAMLSRFRTFLFGRLERIVPEPAEIFFWGFVAWTSVGLLRPIFREPLLDILSSVFAPLDAALATPPRINLFAAWRNTLVVLVALFAVYLVFEFKTLWMKEFPKGFYYAGYAHEGAAWLTVALALATLVLSVIFRGAMLREPGLPVLKKLAWIWSALNLLLAVAVYHRLAIYIDFNGMTRMRTIGLLGVTTVVVGFVLVLVKIVKGLDFLWLVRRQLWTLAFAIYLYVLLPVDLLVHSYNVRRVLAGDLAPVVQVSVHPIDAAGYLALFPLLDSPNPEIRDGLRAMMAERTGEAEAAEADRIAKGWTRYQAAEAILLEKLRASRASWREFENFEKRGAAKARFDQYAYQWY